MWVDRSAARSAGDGTGDNGGRRSSVRFASSEPTPGRQLRRMLVQRSSEEDGVLLARTQHLQSVVERVLPQGASGGGVARGVGVRGHSRGASAGDKGIGAGIATSRRRAARIDV